MLEALARVSKNRIGFIVTYLTYIYLPFVAFAMHQRTDAPIENAILLLEAEYPERTAEIVLPATAIRPRMAAHLCVAFRCVAFAAPFRAGHAQQTRQIASMSVFGRAGFVLCWVKRGILAILYVLRLEIRDD